MGTMFVFWVTVFLVHLVFLVKSEHLLSQTSRLTADDLDFSALALALHRFRYEGIWCWMARVMMTIRMVMVSFRMGMVSFRMCMVPFRMGMVAFWMGMVAFRMGMVGNLLIIVSLHMMCIMMGCLFVMLFLDRKMRVADRGHGQQDDCYQVLHLSLCLQV